MKKVIALQDYSDNYIILQEGIIYNLNDCIANPLIEKGILGLDIPDDINIIPSSTSGTQIANIKINGQNNLIYAPTGESSNVFIINFYWDEDFEKWTSDKTFTEFLTAYSSLVPILAFQYNTLAFKFTSSTTNGQDIDKIIFYFWNQQVFNYSNHNVFDFYTLEMTADGINDGFSYSYELPIFNS